MTHAIETTERANEGHQRFKNFVFINDSSLQSSPQLIDQLQHNPDSNLLSQAKLGGILLVSQIHAPNKIIRQLNSLQFQPTAKIKLVSKTAHDSVIVELQGKLIGLGAEITRQIVVTAIKDSEL